jgi:hypothetical protein
VRAGSCDCYVVGEGRYATTVTIRWVIKYMCVGGCVRMCIATAIRCMCVVTMVIG